MIARLTRAFAAAALLCVSAIAADAQSLLQAGAFNSGHAPMYVTSGLGQAVVADSGPAAGGGVGVGLGELGLAVRGTGSGPFANGGTGPLNTNFCDTDGPTTGAYHFLCFSPNAQGGGLIAYGASRGAPALPLTVNINGTAYQFPISVGGIIGPSSAAIGDIACWNNTIGTLLSDCGVPPSAFGTIAGTNNWTGANSWAGASTFNGPLATNGALNANSTVNAAGPLNSTAAFTQSGSANFTGVFKIAGTTELFPASGNIVGTSDAQTLTNKSMSAGQITGTLTVPQGGTGLPTLTANGLLLGNGTSAPTFLLGTSAGQNPTWNGTTWVPGSAAPRNYISGLTLTNDGNSPNTVIDISAGTAADSTNSVPITLAAFTKSTGGSWVVGSGNNGMGPGLTIANSTWYDVCAAIINGVADVFFDTANPGQTPCAQHPPALTTFVRGIGSFLTNGSAQIVTLTPGRQVFTANGTFRTPADADASTVYKFTVVGGGGGAGGGGQGGGGGGGGTAIYWGTGVAAGTNVAVTVGAGGSGGATASSGGAAGNSSIVFNGVTVTANGGGGGAGAGNPNAGGAGGSSTNGTISIPGGSGGWGVTISAISTSGNSGGGSSIGPGAGAVAGGSAANGVNASSYGGGGSGGGGGNGGGAVGGAGFQGIVIVEWPQRH